MSSQLQELFAANTSPYFGMYTAGRRGIPWADCYDYCANRLGLPIRSKDIKAYQDGALQSARANELDRLTPRITTYAQVTRSVTRYSDFDDLDPSLWGGTDVRWYPCDDRSTPLQRWGYKDGYVPKLYTKEEAIALSPYGYAGQNLYKQPFIVIDIDGVGHGSRDPLVINWGMQYKDRTESWEDPAKIGSFHLYFSTKKVVPIQHYTIAKIDLLGNQTNAAVYIKNKVSNGLPKLEMTDEIWDNLQAYVRRREQERDR